MRIWVNVMEFETRRLLLIGETMLEAKNIDVILDGKALKGLRAFTIEATGSMFHAEVELCYFDKDLSKEVFESTILVGVEAKKRDLLSKTTETVSFLTLICKTTI